MRLYSHNSHDKDTPSAMNPAICLSIPLRSLFSFNRLRTSSNVSSTRSSLSPDKISTLASKSRIYTISLTPPQLPLA